MAERSPRYWFSSLAVLAVLLTAVVAVLIPSRSDSGPMPGPTANAFGVAASATSWTESWTPRFAFTDETVTLELALPGSIATHVVIDTVGGLLQRDPVLPAILGGFIPPFGDEFVQLFDDGTNGDRVAGDSTWSRSGITLNAGAITHAVEHTRLRASAGSFSWTTRTQQHGHRRHLMLRPMTVCT